MLTDDQIDFVAAKMAAVFKKTLQEALREVQGASPPAARNERTKARILAALARSESYAPAYPALGPVLRKKAMTKTVLRRALGGNAVALDEAVFELVQEGKVRHVPAFKQSAESASIELFQLVS